MDQESDKVNIDPVSDDSDEDVKQSNEKPVLTEKEKQLRESLMQDIYNDMSSSSDEEEKASDPTPKGED